jgi:hypothetical protein
MTQQEEERLEQSRYDTVLKSLQVMLSHPHGKVFIKYLFESFEVGKVPPAGLYGDALIDLTSFYRAGSSIYEICLAASPELTGSLIAEMIREKEKQNVQETIIQRSK